MPRRTLWLFCLALIPYGWLTYHFNWVCDDAFISFRYSKHLAQGQGLRFNVDEQPPVEGYSNFLWVLVLAPFEAIGWPAAGPARVLSVACGLLLLFRLATHLSRDAQKTPWIGAAALLAYALLPATALWSTSGLATMAFALLIFLAFENLGRPGRSWAAALICGGLVLIRAEGFAWAAGLIVIAGLEARLDRRFSAALRPLAIATGATLVSALGMLAFRLSYFGYPLPNTVYAKVGLSWAAVERGARYAGSFFLTFPHLGLILIAGAILTLVNRSSQGRLRAPLLIAGAFFAYSVLTGGDFMPMGRFLVPALPFITLVLAALLAKAPPPVATGLATLCVVGSLAPAFDRHLVPEEMRRQLDFRWNVKEFGSEVQQWQLMRDRVALGEELGRALALHTQAGETLPYGRIGAVAYFSKLFILDQNGLVDLEVARGDVRQLRSAGHDKTVPVQYFLKQRPTYYRAKIAGRPLGDPNLPKVAAGLMADLPKNERSRYAPELIPLEPRPDGRPRVLMLIKRKVESRVSSNPR